jgi:hypothetical protein
VEFKTKELWNKMRTVYKYEIALLPCIVTTIRTYAEASVLSAGFDLNGIPCVWMLVDTDADEVDYHFYVSGTGDMLPPLSLNYIKQLQDGDYIYHLWEIDEPLNEKYLSRIK